MDAVELVKSNVDIFKNNIKKDMDITVTQGNALDLSMYEDNTFDITLVLGPIYHLFKKQDIDKAIKEAIRVTKKGGIIYIAFILFDLTMLYWGFQDKNLFENFGEGKMISKDYMPNNKEEYIFNINHYSTVKEIMNKKIKVPCTACSYCMPCPFGVDIPGCFSSYNERFLLEDKMSWWSYAQTLGAFSAKPAFASKCVECGRCEPHCPQNIEIRKELKTVAKEMEGVFFKPIVGTARRILRIK